MSSQPCDEFAADAFRVSGEIFKETGVDIHFDYPLIVRLVDELDQRALASQDVMDYEELVQGVLGGEVFRNDLEQTAYRRVIDAINGRRMRAQCT